MSSTFANALTAVAEFDREQRWRADGATSMTAWLAARYRMTWGTSREWVRVARALGSLPAIARVFARGELSWDQLRALTKFASPESDAELARHAPTTSAGALEREAARHQKVSERDVEDARRLRRLSVWSDQERPLTHLEATLASDQGEVLKETLQRHAEHIVVADDPLDPQEARLADALVELVCSRKEGLPSPATVVVHAEADVLTGEEGKTGPWLAETEGGSRLASETIRRLACDGRIEWVLERHGRPVGIGRRGRVVPGYLARVLRHRDMTCRFPGCGRTRWLYAHHIVHWARGGSTDLDNLVLLCFAHHALIHEGGWRISGHPSSELRFHDPRGRPVHARAP